MRIESNANEGQVSLPTFFQWLKESKGEAVPQAFYVTKIWLPGKFPDITLETEKFRLRIYHKSALFQYLEEHLSELEYSNAALCLLDINQETKDFAFEVSQSESAIWERLGDAGFELKITKPKASKSRTAPRKNA